MVPEARQRAKGDGGVLTGSRYEGKKEKKEDSVAHWVVVDHLEEYGNQRYVVISNPFHNRLERYTWEHFWNSINHQAIEKNSWWVLRFHPQKMESRGPSPES